MLRDIAFKTSDGLTLRGWLYPANTREGEFGLNYYLHDGLKAVASYGRQFSSGENLNLWTVGIAYRFLVPLGRVGAQ